MFETSSPTPIRSVDRRRAEVRDRVVAAAWQLCREHGLAGLSLRDLAERVGLRAPSLYSYFASKDAIHDAMFAEGQRELLRRLEVLPDPAASRADLHLGTRIFFEFATEDPVRHQLLFQRTLPGFVPSDASYALALQAFERLRRTLDAMGAGAPHLVDLYTALITGLADQQLSNDPGGDRWGRLLADAVDMFCDHAGVPAAVAPTSPTSRRRNR